MPTRPAPRARILVATAAVVTGLVVGLVVVTMISAGNGGSGSAADIPYQPFLAGRDDKLADQIAEGGPVFYPDPRRGTRAFFLDREQGAIVALHVIPPGGTASCPTQWDRQQKRYETCKGAPLDPRTLDRFAVVTQANGEHQNVFVDLRTSAPGPG